MVHPDADLSRLCGRSILIAETNPLIALDLAATIAARGMRPVMYSDLAMAGEAVPFPELAAALVDMDLPFDEHAALVGQLQSNGTPTILTTAWAGDSVADRFPGLTVFEKPVHFPALAQWFAGIG